MSEQSPLDDAKRRLKVEQAVRGFLQVMEDEELTVEEGLVAWNMLGFTIFQDVYPDDSHELTQEKMMTFSQSLFDSRTN